jgi:hypothetical protein
MPHALRLLKNMSGRDLQAYFMQRPVRFPAQVDWCAANCALVKPLIRAIDAFGKFEGEAHLHMSMQMSPSN